MDSSVRTQCAGVKTARTYRITASGAVQSEAQPRRLQQGCHARLKRDPRTARALSLVVPRDIQRSEAGVGAGVEVGGILLWCSRHSKTVDSLTSILLSVQFKASGEVRWPSIEPRAPFALIFAAIVNSSEESRTFANFLQ